MDNSLRFPDIVFTSLTNDELKYILSQSEIKISNMIEEAEILYSRSITIISISLPLLTLVVAYIFKHDEILVNKIAAAIVALFLFIVCVKLRQNIIPAPYKTTGSRPSIMTDIVFYKDIEEGKNPEFYMLLAQLKEAENKIIINEETNLARAGNLKNAINYLFWCPVGVLIIYLLSIFLQF